MGIAVEWFDDWHAIRAAAGDTLDRAHQPSPFDRLDWFEAVARHVHPETAPAVARAADGAGATWLFLRRSGQHRAEPLGCWYSLAFGAVEVGAGDAEARRAAIMASAARRFDTILLHPLDGGEADRLAAALRRAGWWTFADRVSTNWTVETGGLAFEDYWRARPGRLSSTVARRRRKHPLAIHVHHDFDEARWQEYESVYADSWKPPEGSLAFLRAWARREGAAGTLRLGIARQDDGTAVAAQFWTVEGGVATIHKLAHRESAKAASPGSLLSEAMFRSVIERDKVRRISFGLGDEAYKADWMDTPCPVFRIEAHRRRSLRGAAGAARKLLSRLAARPRAR